MNTMKCKCCGQECTIETIGISFDHVQTDAKDGEFLHLVHPTNGKHCSAEVDLYSTWTWQMTDIEKFKNRVEMYYLELAMMFFI